MLVQLYRKLLGKATTPLHPEVEPEMKYLLLGIGNVGAKYYGTRHNIGFEVIDYLLSEHDAETKVEGNSMIGHIKHKGRQVYLVKPTTYVNLSGKALKHWLPKLNVPIENVLIIVDDLHLELGALRLRVKGSDAGHNGLKHIEQTLNTSKYPRLKFGIGNDFPKGGQVNYVLGKWKDKEIEELQFAIPKAAEMALSFVAIGAKYTMDKYNS